MGCIMLVAAPKAVQLEDYQDPIWFCRFCLKSSVHPQILVLHLLWLNVQMKDSFSPSVRMPPSRGNHEGPLGGRSKNQCLGNPAHINTSILGIELCIWGSPASVFEMCVNPTGRIYVTTGRWRVLWYTQPWSKIRKTDNQKSPRTRKSSRIPKNSQSRINS